MNKVNVEQLGLMKEDKVGRGMEVKKANGRRSDDDHHWAFLEEMEAPMWVDLTLEDDDDHISNDTWFELLHPFHHLSSYHFFTPPSPVSKSRGGNNSNTFSFSSSQQPLLLQPKFKTTSFAAANQLKPTIPHLNHAKYNFPTSTDSTASTHKPLHLTLVHSTTISSQSNSTSRSSVTDTTNSPMSKTKLSFSASNSCIKSKPTTHTETNSRVSGHTDGLLLAIMASLRRSHVTRQPARVEIKEQRHPKHRKSSSTNSSVASTTNSGCNPTLAPTVCRNTTPESKQVAQLNYNINDKVKHVKKSDGQRQVGHFRSKREAKVVAGIPVNQETSKNKTSLQPEYRKSSRLQNVQNSFIDGKKPTHYIATTNTRNATGQTILSQGTASKEDNIASLLWPRKALKHSSVEKTEVAQDSKESDNARNKSKNARKAAPRIYFR